MTVTNRSFLRLNAKLGAAALALTAVAACEGPVDLDLRGRLGGPVDTASAAANATAPKPKRQGLPKGMTTGDVTLEIALELLALPRDIGEHPETGKMIKAGIGRFGPFVQHDGKFASIPKDEDVMTIGMNRAVDLIAKKMERDAAKEAAKAAKEGDSSKKDDKKKTPKKKTAKKSTGKKKSASKQKSA